MRSLRFTYPVLFALAAFGSTVEAARKPANSVLLSNVQSLTLRKGLKTTHRRVGPIPQLKCVGGNAKGLYEVDVMRCKNSGPDYDDNNIQWTCTASLPEEFKLGSTDVICEGYDSPNDPYILKGSCGVEYRLVFTGKGEEKYGTTKGFFDHFTSSSNTYGEQNSASGLVSFVFWVIFIGVLLWMIFSACIVRGGNARRPETWRSPWNGGAGGGFGGGGGGNDDPPPPYDWRPPRKPMGSNGSSPRSSWNSGFWTGALGGAAAGYMAGNSANRQAAERTGSSGWGLRSGRSGSSWSNGEGSSRGSTSSARHESTGFGSTSRR